MTKKEEEAGTSILNDQEQHKNLSMEECAELAKLLALYPKEAEQIKNNPFMNFYPKHLHKRLLLANLWHIHERKEKAEGDWK